MMLHSKFCAVWLSLSDVPCKKNFAQGLHIHIEQVPCHLKVAGYQINDIQMTLASSYTFLAMLICADGISVCS